MKYIFDGQSFDGWDELIAFLEENYLLESDYSCYEEMANSWISFGLIDEV